MVEVALGGWWERERDKPYLIPDEAQVLEIALMFNPCWWQKLLEVLMLVIGGIQKN